MRQSSRKDLLVWPSQEDCSELLDPGSMHLSVFLNGIGTSSLSNESGNGGAGGGGLGGAGGRGFLSGRLGGGGGGGAAAPGGLSVSEGGSEAAVGPGGAGGAEKETGEAATSFEVRILGQDEL